MVPEFLKELGHSNYVKIIGIIIPSWAILMIVLERIYPYTPKVKLFRRGFWLDLVWYTILQSKVLEKVIFAYILFGIKDYLGLHDFGPMSGMNFWLCLFIFFITHDFYMYWMHRFQHNNKYLWRTHEAHHSVREVDFLAGSRSHFSEILINQTIEFAPIVFLLDSETAMYMIPAKALLDAVWGMWIHANVNVNTGKLQYLINGPEMHQWHHANHHEVFYKNYSTKIAAWDWIFGTGFLPGLQPLKFYFSKPQMFGLPYAYPNGFWDQLVFAFKRFDFRFIEQQTFYKYILNFRYYFTSKLSMLFGDNAFWVETELFDRKNKRYELDDQHRYEDEGLKYFYKEDKLVYQNEAENQDEALEKFN
jgi:sterol desaturase/sphingolipid hydroxylase (fatty acid hydroxylase superfamily)